MGPLEILGAVIAVVMTLWGAIFLVRGLLKRSRLKKVEVTALSSPPHFGEDASLESNTRALQEAFVIFVGGILLGLLVLFWALG